MPYKNPEQKSLWEWQHRSQRLARRHELRRIEAARKAAQSGALRMQDDGTAYLLPLAAGRDLLLYNPKLVMGIGGLTLLLAARYKKGWSWWIVGVVLVALGSIFHWNYKHEQK